MKAEILNQELVKNNDPRMEENQEKVIEYLKAMNLIENLSKDEVKRFIELKDNHLPSKQNLLFQAGSKQERKNMETTNCDSIQGCVSDSKLLNSMSEWKNTHRTC